MKINRYIFLCLTTVFFIGCTAEPVTEEESTVPVSNAAIPQTITDTEPEFDFSNGFASSEAAFAYLEGTWEILPKGSLRKAGSKVLTFTEDGMEMQLSDGYEGDYVSSSYQISEKSDRIHIAPKEIIGVTNAYNPAILQEEADMQFYACVIDGTDYLILRETGDASAYANLALTTDLKSEEGFWVFRRNVQNTREVQNTPKEIKDSFYGICWKNDTYTYVIQEMEPTEENDHLSLGYCENGHALDVAKYTLADKGTGKKGEILTNPQGVFVTVNEDGNITDIEVLTYLGDGFYQPIAPNENPLRIELVTNPKTEEIIELSDAEDRIYVSVETDQTVNQFQLFSVTEEVYAQESLMPDQKTVFALDKDGQYIFRFMDDSEVSHDYLLEINDQEQTLELIPYEW